MKLVLLPIRRQLAQAFHAGCLARHLGLDALPEGWPEHPEAFDLEQLIEPPDSGPHWWLQLFLHADSGALLGSGGFCGVPHEGCVELGYEIAPVHRGQGWAQLAVRRLLVQAWREPAVQRVIAHTACTPNASVGVLQRCGFRQVAELPNAELGKVWRWQIERQALAYW